MPKLPPPPRIAQKRSGFSSSLAVTNLAVGGHHVDGDEVVDRGPVLSRQPADTAAQGEARDPGVRDDPAYRRQSAKSCVSRSSSPQSTPASALAVRATGSTLIPFIGERSITRPPSQSA